MKYKFQLKFADITKPTNPRTTNMPQAFNWDSNVNYTLNNGQGKVFDPRQQKLISSAPPDIEEEPEDLTTFILTFIPTNDASPTKTDHNAATTA